MSRNDRDPREPCFYCDRLGGIPFLMIGDELHCSRCFEDFTREQFHEYLADFPQEVTILEECERTEILAEARAWNKMCCASPARKPVETCVQRPARKQEAA